MTQYRMSDGTAVDTATATECWEDDTRFSGRQTLYRSRGGRYYIVKPTTPPSAEWVSNEEAARWLLANEYEVPAELTDAAEQVRREREAIKALDVERYETADEDGASC